MEQYKTNKSNTYSEKISEIDNDVDENETTR